MVKICDLKWLDVRDQICAKIWIEFVHLGLCARIFTEVKFHFKDSGKFDVSWMCYIIKIDFF